MSNLTTRCKFQCGKVSQVSDYSGGVKHEVEMHPVSGNDSEENKRFWEASTSGKFELLYCNELPFEVGKEYYLDITEVPI